MSKSVVRSVKNVTKGYSSVQVKVRNATSNDAWGPTGTEMGEIAQMTYNNSNDFYEIMDMLDKRMNDKGKNWRHVLKSLKVLDYVLHEGSELVVTWARKNIYIIKTLREFQYIDEDGRDVGQNVRVSAKELTSLILDEERLRAERHDRKLWKQRVTGLDDFGVGGTAGGSEPPRRRRDRTNGPSNDEDLELRLALEASKNEAEEAKARRPRGGQAPADDDDLAKAIKLSKEEEELRRRELEDNNATSLFDLNDNSAQPSQPQATGWNQGYQQQGAVDWFGNPINQQQQQPQNTGYVSNAYQPTGMQAQQTGLQDGHDYNNPYQQQQQTGYGQAHFQQPQQPYLQQQQTSFNMNNPYSQQNPVFNPQQQQPVQQQQDSLQPGSQNPWATTNSTDSVKAQPTGSNNPFANRPQTASNTSFRQQPTLSTLQEQKTQTQFNSQPFGQSFSTPSQPVSQPQQQQQQPQDPHHANLNALLASGEGQDTFGNTGNLRIPAQHTAPGTFINSAGSGIDRMPPHQTGNNPFLQNQFTGMQQPSYQQPAQTGPAGAYGGGNPYSAGQRGAGQQGGSLIDL